MKKITNITISILLFATISFANAIQSNFLPPKMDLKAIGQKIYQNECSGLEERIISWNKGEEFLSLGIGHFIWFPKNYEGPYQETFPEFIDLVKEKRPQDLPQWLAQLDPVACPWNSRDEFLLSKDSSKVVELRQFLLKTMDIQTSLMVKRAHASLDLILKSISMTSRWPIKSKFFTVVHSPNGMYAIIDYINFKGEGTSAKERYKGKGWGLLQVLEEMRDVEAGSAAVKEFTRAADAVLTRRVNNAPPERDEKRWIEGWRNRIKTYTK